MVRRRPLLKLFCEASTLPLFVILSGEMSGELGGIICSDNVVRRYQREDAKSWWSHPHRREDVSD